MLLRSLLALSLIGTAASCASIVSKSSYPVVINSVPSEVSVVIKDRKSDTVYDGVTPASLTLKANSGYFKRAIYEVKLSQEGYEPLTFLIRADVDGWYFGNLVFGGLIGMLIVDPATGAMYKLPQEYYQMGLKRSPSTSTQGLEIRSIDDVPEELKEKLEPLK